jgi:hypothetical protein
MVAVDTSSIFEVDLSGNPSAIISYNTDGSWTNNTQSKSGMAKKAILYKGKNAVKPVPVKV